ncbi:hypothetical protein GFM07_41545, partial [Rhizobium leguminosarum bv. viciae]|nr:hypothetical protein [Rhizobium leguminosarum bv. viciae]
MAIRSMTKHPSLSAPLMNIDLITPVEKMARNAPCWCGINLKYKKCHLDRELCQVHDYRRTKFGPKSEKLDPAQMELALEDLETVIAETQARIAAVEKKIEASAPTPTGKTRSAITTTRWERTAAPLQRSSQQGWAPACGQCAWPDSRTV